MCVCNPRTEEAEAEIVVISRDLFGYPVHPKWQASGSMRDPASSEKSGMG